jgi:tetratricopeptide (TPR) repeat protein
MKRDTAIGIACVGLASFLLATAAAADAVQDCNSNTIDRRISGCTAALRNAALSKRNKALLHARRGDAYMQKKNDEAALADFKSCLALDPKQEFCRDRRSRIQCSKVLAAEPSPSDIEMHCAYARNSKDKDQQALFYRLLGLAHFRVMLRGDGQASAAYGKALDNISRAIAIRSAIGINAGVDHDTRGLIYMQNKAPGSALSRDADKALQDFSKAISLSPNVAAYYLHRGYAHNQLLKPEAAWADFQKARALDPSDAAIRDAYEKQRKISPEGQNEIRKRLDDIRNSGAKK